MAETHSRRRAALRSRLRERDLDALLVTDLLNVRYLTGFTGSNAALLVHSGDEHDDEARTVFCTDGRYLTQSAAAGARSRADGRAAVRARSGRAGRGGHGVPPHRLREPPGHRRRNWTR